MMWIVAAVLSALFAGVTSILAKCGIRSTDSDVATAIRTGVVLAFAWAMVLIVGSAPTITAISARSLVFLVLSGLATGASWICYFKALSLGDVNEVVPIDKSSTVLTVLLAIILFGETNHLAVKLVGTALIGLGVFLMIEKKDVAKGADFGASASGGCGWLPYAIGSAVFAALTAILARWASPAWSRTWVPPSAPAWCRSWPGASSSRRASTGAFLASIGGSWPSCC